MEGRPPGRCAEGGPPPGATTRHCGGLRPVARVEHAAPRRRHRGRPVRDRPAQLDRVLGTLEGLACVVVDDASHDAAEHQGDRRTAWGPLHRAARPTSVRPAPQRRAGRGAQHARRLRGLGLRPGGRLAATAPGVLRRPAGRGRRAAHRAAPGHATRRLARYQRMRSSLDRGPVAGLVRPGGPIPFVPSAALLVAPTWRRAPTSSIHRCAAARTSTWSGA